MFFHRSSVCAVRFDGPEVVVVFDALLAVLFVDSGAGSYGLFRC